VKGSRVTIYVATAPPNDGSGGVVPGDGSGGTGGGGTGGNNPGDLPQP
jgi:hypothetical protein